MPRAPQESPYPLSFVQENVGQYSQSQQANAAYTVARSFELCGSLNVDALREAMTRVAKRHAILRTTLR